MNYTKNYQLPQWAEGDRIMMEDFNQMCADIDGGMAVNRAAASAAQAAADAARTEAAAAQSTADGAFCPANMPYVVGSYVGDGSTTTRTITLGFKPSFLIVSGQNSSTQIDGNLTCIAAVGGQWPYPVAELVTAGFTVQDSSSRDPKLNQSNITYHYIAFR